MFCDIKPQIDSPIVRHVISAAVFDDSEEGLNKWAEKIRVRESRQLYAWVEDNSVIGVCDFERHLDFVEILTIAVAENARKRGIGSAMVAALQNMYHLPIEAETDDDAVEFYRKCGFETTAIRKYEMRRWTCVLPAPQEINRKVKTLQIINQSLDKV
jgi:ribosomal protein S18 acetylase RimI-like enzyme